MIAPVDGHDAHRAHHGRRGRRAGAGRGAARGRPGDFDRLDVDGCMSTNDTVLVLASGASGVAADPVGAHHRADDRLPRPRPADAGRRRGRHQARSRCAVTGAATEDDAVTVARTVARDSLVQDRDLRVGPQLGPHRGGGRVRGRGRRPRPARHHVNGVLLCRGGVAAGGRTRRRPVGQGGARRGRPRPRRAAPRTSSPRTCRTPTWRRTVPTPPDGTLARLAHAGEKAAVLAEALPWLQRFHGRIVVVKYGGNAMIDEELKQAFAQDMVFLRLAGHPAGRRARRRPADHRDAGPAGPARGVPRRPARHHAGDDRRGPDGAGRPGRSGAGRADQPARPVRRRPLRARTRACSPPRSAPRWSAASPSTSAWSATSSRSTPTPCSTSSAAGRIPVVAGVAPDVARHRLQHQRRQRRRRARRRARRGKLVVLTDVEGLYAN